MTKQDDPTLDADERDWFHDTPRFLRSAFRREKFSLFHQRCNSFSDLFKLVSHYPPPMEREYYHRFGKATNVLVLRSVGQSI
jgi:hypothetical protein